MKSENRNSILVKGAAGFLALAFRANEISGTLFVAVAAGEAPRQSASELVWKSSNTPVVQHPG
jgi:hypothetical protein